MRKLIWFRVHFAPWLDQDSRVSEYGRIATLL